MLSFVTCVGHPEKFRTLSQPGVARSMGNEPFRYAGVPSKGDVFAVYADAMRIASACEGVEALVMLHDDLELRDPAFASKVRAAFTDPDVAVVGLIGSRGAKGLAWWEGERAGRVTDLAYGLHDFGFDKPDVHSLDGMLLILSPWATRHLFLDGLGYEGLHGYADELCTQARERGKRVIVADIEAFHHSKGGYTGGRESFDRAEAHYQSRWGEHARKVRCLREHGTDSLSHFGNGYTHEGGLYLQQNPDELASLLLLLESRKPAPTYLEIGSASGGAARFVSHSMRADSILSIDDGQHPRAVHQDKLLPHGTLRFRGDSHSDEARVWLGEQSKPDVAFIDGDHSYAGITQDLAMVLPRCNPGALVVLHDTVACEGVKRAWEELLASGKVRKVDEFVGKEKPLGIGVAEVVERKADPWAMLREKPPAEWDINAMYDAYRGGPVSDEPMVHLVVPSYREGFDVWKRTEPSRVAIIQDLNDHGMSACRSDIDGDSLIQRMRQRAMHLFLKGTATHMLWCDLDIEALDPTCVRKMLASGHDLIAGACPFKDTTKRVVFNPKDDITTLLVEGSEVQLPHGCLEVHDVGTGFQLVSRKAIVAMMMANPDLLHWSRSSSDVGEPLWALYDTGVVDGVYESEDFMFCRYWQRLGGKVYVYVPATFRHYGTHGFEGSLMEQLGWEVRA